MPPFLHRDEAVAWHPWGGDAFRRAAGEDKPILLAIGAAWCRASRMMDCTSYADPEVAALVNARFVPVRVDADRRPDIADRYGLGGWPTTAFLTPAGELLGGGTYVPRERMPGVLARVDEAYRARRHDLRAAAPATDPAPEPPAVAPPAAPVVDRLCARILEEHDAAHGGLGAAPKCPHEDALSLALARWRETGDARLSAVVVSSLDAMGWRGLYDEVEGGFFRGAAGPDWGRPHSEKLLDVNAALLRLFLDAAETLDLPRYRERAVGAIAYVRAALSDGEDGFFASQQADEEYYAAATIDERRRRPAPAVDRALYTDWNAAMAAACLDAGGRLGDDALSAFAVRSLERTVLATYRPGHGVAHWFDGPDGVRGLLTDQVAASAALLDAWEATGNGVYEEMAEELMHYCIRTMWDERAGGFFDRLTASGEDEVGLLRRRLKPFLLNCRAARVLIALAAASGDAAFREAAGRTLDAMAGPQAEQGLFGAAYALALRERARSPC